MSRIVKCRADEGFQILEYGYQNGWMINKTGSGSGATYDEARDCNVYMIGLFPGAGDTRIHAEWLLSGELAEGLDAILADQEANGSSGVANKNEVSWRWRNVEVIEVTTIATAGYSF